MLQKFKNILGPAFLICLCPPSVILMWYTNTELQGSFLALWNLFANDGLFPTLYMIWRPVFFGSPIAWTMIGIFAVFEFLLMRFLPGETFYSPLTSKGNVTTYKANGVLAFILTITIFCLCSFTLKLFAVSIIYDHFGEILGALNILSFIVCTFLYFKGRYFPSTSDCGYTKNFIFDFYWGTELYPKVFNVNIKAFIAARFGMMSWGLILISYAGKQAELFGLSNAMMIAVGLQFLYLGKFYLWETGYFRSLDMMHDRAGFYICWGCLVWVPCIYTSPTMYLVLHPIHLSHFVAVLIASLGAASILINYFADRQRQQVRLSDGHCRVWGKAPAITIASYQTEQGETKQSILLASGWWGVARHFHYVPEVLGAFFWSVPALFSHFAPYFYVCFLAILLSERAFRDDRRCAQKYGKYWDEYCSLVPYKIIPYVI